MKFIAQKYVKHGLLALTLAASTTAAMASKEPTPMPKASFMENFYVYGGVGYADIPYKNTIGSSSTIIWTRGNGGKMWTASLGYIINENFAFEVGYTPLPRIKMVDLNHGNLGEVWGTFKHWALHASLIGTIPLTERLDVMGFLGVHYQQLFVELSPRMPHPTFVNYSPRMGVGLRYNYSDSLAFEARYSMTQGRVKDILKNYKKASRGVDYAQGNFVSVGLRYRFK